MNHNKRVHPAILAFFAGVIPSLNSELSWGRKKGFQGTGLKGADGFSSSAEFEA
jgi:hypothetical protein